MENLKYKLLGWTVISLVLFLLYLLFKPSEDDINSEKYNNNQILSIQILKRTEKTPKVITSNDSIQVLTKLLEKCVKEKISSPKGGSDWIDVTINYKNSDSDFLRFYENKLHGNYISGQNHYYKNDSLFKKILKISQE